MQRDNLNINPEWDAVLGTDTQTGTLRLLGLILHFVVAGGSAFHFLI